MSEALKKAREALQEIALAGMSGSGQESEEGMRDWHARRAWEFIGIASRALAAIDAEAKPVVRMLTDVEFEECCGGCKVTSAAMTWMCRSVSKFAEVNGLTIGEHG